MRGNRGWGVKGGYSRVIESRAYKSRHSPIIVLLQNITAEGADLVEPLRGNVIRYLDRMKNPCGLR